MISTAGTRRTKLETYERMLRIRRFEERCQQLTAGPEPAIVGSIHLCAGQEAIPVGAVSALDQRDRVLATYRGHGWAIECGVPLDALLGEICHRAGGVNGGRAGSPYLIAPEHGFLGENSIVAAGVPVATGVALAAQLDGDGGVAVVSVGEGATSQGAFHEALVFAAARSLPMIVICENNGWSEMTPISAIARVDKLSGRAAGYGVAGTTVDGCDPHAVYDAVAEAVARARDGSGPSIVECMTVRLMAHYNRDIEHYRPAHDREEAVRLEPVGRARRELEADPASAPQLDTIDAGVDAEIDAAAQAALAQPLPDPATASNHVVADASGRMGDAVTDGESMTYAEAVRAALSEELEARPETVLYGEDVALPGGIFGVTRGLSQRFSSERVFDMPIAESAILGSAVGAALMGKRPIVEVMWSDFLLVALDQLVNQAANVRYISRGTTSAPLVVRTQQGATAGSCAQHSQSLEALLAHIPGLRVGMPSTAHDAYAMLRAAVADPDPCVIIESRALYTTSGVVDRSAAPECLGGARWRRRGGNATVISWGTCVDRCLEAAALVEGRAEVGVLDLRWLSPLDDDAIHEAVTQGAGRVLIVHEANRTCGVGAEVAARIAADHMFELDAPVRRVATPDVRMPASPVLQAALVPAPDTIAEAIRSLCELGSER